MINVKYQIYPIIRMPNDHDWRRLVGNLMFEHIIECLKLALSNKYQRYSWEVEYE